MGMYALIEDAQQAALEAANCWHETEEARELLAKIDAFEALSDRWCGECPEAAKGFMEAAHEAEDALDDLRRDTVDAAADAMIGRSDDRRSDEWLDAWDAADSDAPPLSQILATARRAHAGDDYLRRFGA